MASTFWRASVCIKGYKVYSSGNLMAIVRTIRRYLVKLVTRYRKHVLWFRQYIEVTFLYVTDRSSIQLIKLSDLVQGHLPGGLLYAGLAHGSCPCGSAAQRSMGHHWPCDPESSRLECGLAPDTDAFYCRLLRWSVRVSLVRLTVVERMRGVEQLGYSS